MNIVILAGGYGEEREVSLSSGKHIFNALNKNHKVVFLDLLSDYSEINSFNEALSLNLDFNYTNKPDWSSIEILVSDNIVKICRTADFCFIALHGDIGENGKIQALFDLNGISYNGSKSLGSAIAMDKVISKELMEQNNILTPKWQTLNCHEDINLDFPLISKPKDGGSSAGIKIIKTNNELLELRKSTTDDLLLEEKISGREFSAGVLGNEALPIIEIVHNGDIFDYNSKYTPGLAQEICPANITEKLKQEMQLIAVKVGAALRLSVYYRVDFIVDKDHNIYCIEANSLPGMTETSLLPKEAQADGINYSQLCEKIIQYSLSSAN